MVLTFISISHVSILRPSFGVIETIRPVKVVSSRAEALLLLRRVILFHSEKIKIIPLSYHPHDQLSGIVRAFEDIIRFQRDFVSFLASGNLIDF